MRWHIKEWKKIICILLSLMLVCFQTLPTFAASRGYIPDLDNGYVEILNEYGLDGYLVEKVIRVSEHIYYEKRNNCLKVDLPDDTLLTVYAFSEQQLKDFHDILDGRYQAPKLSKSLGTLRSTRFYLSNQDLKGGIFSVLGSASMVGPAALMAAWTSVSSALAGPLGVISGLAVSALGYGFFANLASTIVGALAQGKGVAFYLDWKYPPVSAEIE